MQKESISKARFIVIAAVMVTYLTISLFSDLASYRLVMIAGITFAGSHLVFTALYPLLDMLTRLVGAKTTVILILFFHLGDMVFSYVPYLINQLPYPAGFIHQQAFNIVLAPLPIMFWSGILGSLLASIAEIFIYRYIQTKIKSFFISAFISTAIILIAHNLPVDFIAYRRAYPDLYITITITNFFIGLTTLTCYAFFSASAMKLIKTKILRKTSIAISPTTHEANNQ